MTEQQLDNMSFNQKLACNHDNRLIGTITSIAKPEIHVTWHDKDTDEFLFDEVIATWNLDNYTVITI